MVDVVLVEPEIAGNLGAIARAMKNFNLNKLIVIKPKFDINSEEVRNRAKHANDIIDKIKIVNSIKELDYDYKIATTGKLSSDYNLMRTPMTPKEFSEKIKKINHSSMAIFFGRESCGLTNKELELMDFIVNIPTSENYKVLNLSHAATIIFYELFNTEGDKNLKEKYKPIGKNEKETLEKLHTEIISKLEFEMESKKKIQLILWKKIISKSMLSNREAFALMGLLRKIKEKIK